MRKRGRHRPIDLAGPRRSRGVAAVEFAITVPVILLSTLAAAEIGRAFVHFHTLSYAVRGGTRYLSEHAIDGTTGVVSISNATITRVRNLAVYANEGGTGNRVLPNLQVTDIAVSSSGNDVQVQATYPYQPMIGNVLPSFGNGADIGLNFAMRVTVTMRAIS